MNASSFSLYADPVNSGAYANAERTISNALAIGQTLQFQWGINYHSGSANGGKGIDLFAGNAQILNIHNGDNDRIRLNNTDIGFNYGTSVMNMSFARISTNAIRVSVNPRSGAGVNFTTNINVESGALNRFKFYAYGLQGGNEAKPYFNDFAISNTPAGLDTNPPTIALANGVNKVTWVALNGTVNLSTNDVTAADAGGSVSVSLSPTSVVTTNNNFTTVTYTATDAAGYRSSVTRVIAVGNSGDQWFYSIYNVPLTISTVTSGTVGGQLWVDGATLQDAGQATGVQAWVGVNTNDNDPATWQESAWSLASYAGKAGNNDKYEGVISGSNRAVGTYYYATRFRLGTNGGNTNFFYGGIDSNWQGGRWGTTRTNTNNVVFTNGNGILTVIPGREVTFALDMRVQQFKNAFVSGETVVVSGDFNGWGTNNQLALDSDGLHRVKIGIPGAVGATNYYKFRILGTDRTNDGLQYESISTNRPLVLEASNQTLPKSFFNDVEESRRLSLSLDMSGQVTKGNFTPGVHTAAVRSSLDGFAGSLLMNRVGSTSTYSLDYYLDGPLSAVPANLDYKFFNSAANAPNFGYEGDQPGGGNRRLFKTDINSTNLSTTTIPLATFVDVPLPDTSFTGWRGGTAATPELLTQYAFGAPTPTDAVNRSNLPSGGVIGSNLTITYFVRSKATNTNLVLPQWHTNLSQSNLWTDVSTSNITNVATNTVDGVEVIQRRASVPMDEGRKFLRLKISE